MEFAPLIQDAAALAALVPKLEAAEAIAIDTETTALSPFEGRLRILGLGLPGHVYLIDVDAVPDLSPLAALFAAPRPIKVLHNAKFDLRWLAMHGGLAVNGLFDTMLASQLLGEAHEHDLAAVAERWLGEHLDKSLQASNWGGTLSPGQLAYASQDVAVLLPLRHVLRAALLEAGLKRVAALEFGVVPVVASMEQTGVALNVTAWKQVLARMQAKHDDLDGRIQGMLAATRTQLALLPEVAGGLNLNSTQQVRQALARLGIEVADTHESSLLAVKDRHPVVPLLLEYRTAQKGITAYGEGLLTHVRPDPAAPGLGRIHASFQQLVTFTGRFSCSSPNLQNIPADPEYRACFIAPPGYRLVVADYSQIELRILAEISGDAAFRRAFADHLDLHRMTASEMFWVPYDEVTKAQRNQAKGINFGLVYGRGAPSLADELGVTVERARELINRYFDTYRGVHTWLDETARTAVRQRELRSIAGRRARFKFDEHDRGAVASVERQGKNFPIQATNSDILKQAIIDLGAVLPPMGSRLVNCVHDELVVEAPRDSAEHVAAVVRATMVAAGAKFLREVPLEVEVAVGDAWFK